MLALLAGSVFAGQPSELTEQIDRQIEAGWEERGVRPAEQCTDEVFVRRVYLDLVGRIPTEQEQATYLADGREEKRQILIETLVQSEDYVQHFADTFDALLMGRGGKQKYAQRAQHGWRDWLESVFRDNRPWDQAVREMLLARPQSTAESGAVWYLYERENNYQAIAESVAANVFGVRIDCAQCHDHMMAYEIEQAHYWGMVAFFNRGKNEMTPHGPRIVESAIGGFSEFANIEGSSSPNLLTFLASTTVAEERPAAGTEQKDDDELYVAATREGEPRVPKFSRREKLVDEVVAGHPLVAKAFVNRLWAMLLGRGIVHPFDQMDSTHPPSHSQLLDLLADDFRQSNYDIRRLVMAIANSRPYQLQSRQPEDVSDPESFAWYLQRPLTAEQMARSLQVGLRGGFENQHPLVHELRSRLPEVMPETVTTGVSESLFLSNNPALIHFINDSR